MTDVRDKLDQLGIRLRHYGAGQHYTLCPQCSHTRKPHNRKKPCLSVVIDSEGIAYNCKNDGCGFTGGIKPDDDRWKDNMRSQADMADKKRRDALELWATSEPITGTEAEEYLRWRGIQIALPDSLRFHHNIPHHTSRGTYYYRGMLAGVTDPKTGRICAIQRTYLQHGRKAGMDNPKLSLGAKNSGCVSLAPPEGMLGLAEGVETGLSAQQIFKVPVWVTLGASSIPSVHLPDDVHTVVVFGDNNQGGIEAVQKLKEKHDNMKSRKWKKTISWKFPPPEFEDWNDELQARVFA